MSKRVLVFSENQLLSDLITTNLRKRGFEATSTSLARSDRRRWTHLGAELLLLDVDPPGCDALEAVQSLERLGWKNEIPVVALCDEMPNRNGAAARKRVQWVVKPFTVEALLSTVKRALGIAESAN